MCFEPPGVCAAAEPATRPNARTTATVSVRIMRRHTASGVPRDLEQNRAHDVRRYYEPELITRRLVAGPATGSRQHDRFHRRAALKRQQHGSVARIDRDEAIGVEHWRHVEEG